MLEPGVGRQWPSSATARARSAAAKAGPSVSSRSTMPERVHRDPRVELHAAFGRRHHVALEELAHRLDELGRGRSVLGHRSPTSVEDVEHVPFGLGDAAARASRARPNARAR